MDKPGKHTKVAGDWDMFYVTPFGPARQTRGAGQGFSMGVGKVGRISS